MPEHKRPPKPAAAPPVSSLFPVTAAQRRWVRSVVRQMPLREKAGQVVVPGFNAFYYGAQSPEYKAMLRLVQQYGVGGFCFFNGTVRDYAALTTSLQLASKIPLLMSADFERGLAMRIRDAVEFPSHMGLAAAGSTGLIRKTAAAIAREAKAIGIQQNFAPVADNNTDWRNPIVNTRAFSDDPKITARYCRAFIAGTAGERVLSTVKHFPGHGRTWVDSHRDMPVINATEAELFANELVPFTAAINAGVHSVMVGHLSVPAVEPDAAVPASLSHEVITGMLRRRLGFNGLIVTDAMNMYAVTDRYSAAEAAVASIAAGVDMLLFPPDPEIACDAVYNALCSGVISTRRIDESIERILMAKCWVNNGTNVPVALPDNIVSCSRHIALAAEAAARSVTVTLNGRQVVPLKPGRSVICINVLADEGADTQLHFGAALRELLPVRQLQVTSAINGRLLNKLVEACSGADTLVVAVYLRFRAYRGEIGVPAKISAAVSRLLRLRKKSVLVVFGSPYVAKFLPGADAQVFAFSDSRLAQAAAANAVAGIAPVHGRLPVRL